MSSFIADKIVMDGLTYDDVLLIPAYSEVLPRTVELTTKFSRHIELKVPFVTAAMDTVTEAPMAIAIAREGGIGVIHKNMSIEEQARQVAIVKRAENGMIYDPVTIKRGRTVGDALNMMSEYHIGGIPVVDDENKLVGIVTNRDLRFEQNPDRKIDEVMTSENLVTTHQQTDLSAAAKILQENKIEKLPVVDKDGRLVGLITYKDITKAKDKPMACKDEKGRLRVAAGVGVTADTLDRMRALVEAGADAIVIDTAHGHSKYVVEKLKAAKAEFPNVDIVVGNVATGEAAKMLVEAGADGVKENGKRAYSSYLALSAPFKLGGLDWTVDLGMVPWETTFYNGYTSGFCVTDISLGASKEIKITDSFSVPAFAKVSVNPRTEGAYFAFGLSF